MKKIKLTCLILFAINATCAQNTWTPKATFVGIARVSATAFSINGKGYMGTGKEDDTFKKDFWKYDPDNNTWTQKADFGGFARMNATGFAIGGKGYIGTGTSVFLYTDFWEYDTAANSWTQKADFAGLDRYLATGFSIGNKGYIGGGYTFGGVKKDFWEYDPAKDTWIQKADFGGGARYGASGFSIGSRGYMGTGSDGSVYHNDFWEFDTTANSWTQKSNLPGPIRVEASGFSIGSKGYMGFGFSTSSTVDDFWEFDPSANSWTQKAKLNPRYGQICFSTESKGYIGMGTNGVVDFDDFQEYSPGTNSISTNITTGPHYCGGDILNVSYTPSGTYYSGNTFTVQLSNGTGSFGAPVNIGTVIATGTGTIPATIPSNTPTGSGYRVRVISDKPSVTGTDNGTNFTINALPVSSISYSGTPYCATGTATVTLTGLVAGTYVSSPGLAINSNTGAIDLSTSIPGTYTVSYSFSNGNCDNTTSTTVKINALPAAMISYSGSPYCPTGTATVTRTGQSGGTYSSTSGLVIDAGTGTINLAASTPATYTVTYGFANASCANTATTTITINALPVAAISYSGSPYCALGTAAVTRTGTSGGTYSSTPGLVIDPNTGTVSLASSSPGSYTVTYSFTNGTCSNTSTTGITITALPAASISYNAPQYCASGSATVIRTGPAGGTYSSTAGLAIDANTGAINLATSSPGPYVVTYNFTNGSCNNTATTNVTINAYPVATIFYSGSPYCATGTATVTRTGQAGGTYSSATGLIINPTSGTVNLAASTPGSYPVTYSYTNNGCTNTSGTSITVNPAPNVAQTANQTVCNNSAVAVNFSSSPGTQINWQNNKPSIGLAASGSGNIAFTAINSTNVPVTATVTVTPSSGNFAYVPNFNSDNVSVINIATAAVVATIAVGSHPYGASASPDGSRVYVTNYGSDNVYVINTVTNTVTAIVPVGSSPQGVSVSPDGSRVYVANNVSGNVSVINTATNLVVATVTVGSNPFGLSVTPDGSKVYVANFTSGNISVINTATNTVVNTVTVGSSPWGISLNPGGSRVYIANNGSASVSVINTTTEAVIATIPVGSSPVGVSVSPDGSRLYVANNGPGTLSVINTATNAAITNIAVGANPFGVSVSPDGSRVYVANNHSANVSVINTATNSVVATLPVGSSPTALGNFITGNSAACPGSPATFTVTVLPTPSVNTVASQTTCNKSQSAQVNFTGTVGGTAYSWTNNNTSIGLGASGNGNIPSFTATNSTNAPVTATVTVTPSTGSFAYVPGYNADKVSVINLATGAVVDSIVVGSQPFGISICPDGSRAYVTNNGSGDVSVINTATNSVVATIPVESRPAGISVSPDGSKVYVAQMDGFASVINTATNTVADIIPDVPLSIAVAVSPDGSQVYFVDFIFRKLLVVNTATNSVTDDIPLGTFPNGISVSLDGSRIYVAMGSNDVSVINAADYSVIATIPVGTGPSAMVLSPDGTRLYVANTYSDEVSVINTATNTVITTISVGSEPSGVSLNSDGSLLYVANFNSGTLSVINTASNSVVATIPAGLNPSSVGNFIVDHTSVCSGPSKTFTITVNPTPVITCPGDQSANTSGSCTAVVSYSSSSTGSPAPAISYVFGGATTGSGSGNGSGSAFNAGTTVVTLKATDTCGVYSTCTFNVTVHDNTLPVINNCPADVTVQTGAGNTLCSHTATWTEPTATDNCSGLLTFFSRSHAPGSTFNVGSTPVTYVFRDAAGNQSTCTFNVVVRDDTKPVVNNCPADITVQTGAGNTLCSHTATWTEPTATDNCSGSLTFFSRSHAPGSTFNVGSTPVTYVFRDAAGNQSTCTFNIVVQDDTKPVINNCPADINTQTGSGNTLCSHTGTWTEPTATDNCSGPLTFFSRSHAPGSTFNVGSTPVTYVFRDAAGNQSTCTFNVVVQDDTKPFINNCPTDVTVQTGAGNASCSQTATWTEPTMTGDCSGTILTYLSRSHAPGSTFNLGSTPVTYVFLDAAGNQSTCTFNVIVRDNTKPVINCNIGNASQGFDDNCSAIVSDYTGFAGASDNCSSVTVTQLPAPGTTIPGIGSHDITLTATDASGNFSTCTFPLVLTDNTAPLINCPGTIIVDEDPEGSNSASVPFNVTATDCSSFTTVTKIGATEITSPHTFPTGITEVEAIATDIYGNQSSCSFAVVVNPSCRLTCPPDIYVNNDGGDCGARVSYTLNIFNCGTLVYTPESGTLFPVGTTTVTVSSPSTGQSCSFKVTVTDIEGPTIFSLPDVSVPANSAVPQQQA